MTGHEFAFYLVDGAMIVLVIAMFINDWIKNS